jgi:hypothetical protein
MKSEHESLSSKDKNKGWIHHKHRDGSEFTKQERDQIEAFLNPLQDMIIENIEKDNEALKR